MSKSGYSCNGKKKKIVLFSYIFQNFLTGLWFGNLVQVLNIFSINNLIHFNSY